jgi:hypothetical protein
MTRRSEEADVDAAEQLTAIAPHATVRRNATRVTFRG